MSQKNVDKKNRLRNKIVAFRMSLPEAEQLDTLVKISGLTKQDYIISRLSCKDVIVNGNPKVYKALRDKMAEIHKHLQSLCSIYEVPSETLEILHVIAITLQGLNSLDRKD